MKVIGIVGSRRRNSPEDLELTRQEFLKVYEKGDTIVSGGCPRGADYYAEIFAKEYNIPIKIHYADWDTYGKSAGFRRNGDIAKDADVLIACRAPDLKGGTEDTCKKAEGLGKIVISVPQPPSKAKEQEEPPKQDSEDWIFGDDKT